MKTLRLLALLAVSCAARAPTPTPTPVATQPALTTTASAPPQDPAPPMNPFFDPSPLLHHAPPFDRIQIGDYEPAIDEGMKRHLQEIDAIKNLPDAPTFENTLVAMEKSGQLLERAERVFFAMTSANTSDELQAIERRVSPKLAAHSDAIELDAALWKRIKAVYEARASLDPDARLLAERYHRNFVRAGAELSEPDKAQLRAMNEEESTLGTEFGQKLLAATKEAALVIDKREDLKGLTSIDVGALAEAASARHLDGKWLFALQNTIQQPALASLEDRGVRERLFRASSERAERGDANDTRAIVLRLVALRARKAKLLGYPSYAAYALEDQMAETPAKATKLMTDMVPAALAKVRAQATKLQALASHEQGAPTKLAPSDWQYYSEKLRKSELAIDEAEVKAYFELDRVLRDGVFFAAHELYGLTFQERHDLPVYHPDVRVFEVFEEGGRSLGLFYADYFRRDNKNGGAWSTSVVSPSPLLGTAPVVFNVCNFPKPSQGQPALLDSGEVRTIFHEFGHALHALLTNVKYPSVSGVPRDFVEFPSQFNEHWAREPTVLARYAKHYATGAPMPPELVAKLDKAYKFDQGFALTEYLEAALVDMAWHTLGDGATPKDVAAFQADALHRFGVDFPAIPPRYDTSTFMHIWKHSYSARYYAYLWCEVLAHDAYKWFTEHGGMTRANGQRFREMILSRGRSAELAPMYRAFRGADPSVQPLLEYRGLAHTTAGGRRP